MSKCDEIKDYAIRMMEKHGLWEWKFAWKKTKRIAGQCDYTRKTIFMSKILCEARDVENSKNTVLHEIAHALVGPEHGHDATWRNMFINIGGNGKRCYELADHEEKAISYRYALVHKDTGVVYEKYHRKPTRTIKHCEKGILWIRGKKRETLGNLEVRKIG